MEAYAPTETDGPWVHMACRNHPNLRWTRKNPATMHNLISRNPQLMFNGAVDNPKRFTLGDPFNLIKDWSDIGDAVNFVSTMMKEGYVFECPCPLADLYYIKD